MSVATLQSETRAFPAAFSGLQRSHGEAVLVFARREGVTVLRDLYQVTPCRVLLPDAPANEPRLAVLLTTSGGLTGGDTVNLRIAAEAGAAVTVTTQAAEKLYRSLGPDTHITIDLTVAEGCWLEYLPQETILFDGARLDRRTSIAIAPEAQFLGCEMVAFGRAASAERLTHGRLFDRWRLWRGGKLIWADATLLDETIAQSLASPFGFAGASAFATALYVGAEAPALLPLAQELAALAPCGAATRIGDLILARFFDHSTQSVRASLALYLSGLRAAAGRTAMLPRLWDV
jgi:urease accessory protein